MRIISVDDERGCLTTFELICKEIPDVEYLQGFDNPTLVLDFLKENDVDVVFLDIEMPMIDGLKLAEQIHELNPDIEFVFVTAHSNYALQAFGMDASGYILKPYNKIEIEQKIKKLQNISGETPHHQIRVSTFGKFDIFVDGHMLHFSSN
ncbi:MAG: response regulator, partial [Oscillospiraceae bacterium]